MKSGSMTSTITVPATAAPRLYRPPEHRLTFAGVVRSEWIKFRSVRSVVWTMIGAVVCTVALGAAATAATVAVADGAKSEDPSAGGLGLTLSLAGAGVATLIVAAVGAMVITNEYSSGMIRTTLAVAPRRLQVLAAKAVVLAFAVTLFLGAAVVAAFFLGQSILASIGHESSITDPGVLRVVLGHVAVLTGVSLIGLGLGALTRHAAGAIFAVVALLFVVPLLLLPLPDFAGKALLTDYNLAATTNTLTAATSGGPSVTISAIAFLAWVAFFLGAGALAMQQRDVM